MKNTFNEGPAVFFERALRVCQKGCKNLDQGVASEKRRFGTFQTFFYARFAMSFSQSGMEKFTSELFRRSQRMGFS